MDTTFHYEYVFALMPLIAFGVLGWRVWKYGGIVGAFVGARIKDTLGEVHSSISGFKSRTYKVQLLDVPTGTEPSVVLVITSKSEGGSSTNPIKLSRADAVALGALLSRVMHSP
jgi:hypothetical protein